MNRILKIIIVVFVGFIIFVLIWIGYFILERIKQKAEHINNFKLAAGVAATIAVFGLILSLISNEIVPFVKGLFNTETEENTEIENIDEPDISPSGTDAANNANDDNNDNGAVNTDNHANDLVWTLNSDNSMSYDGHTYAIYDRRNYDIDSYYNMEVFCEKLGGHLAVINSEEENQAIYQYVLSQGYTMAYFGYSDEVQEENWQWVMGDSTYTNWAEDQPNNGVNNKNKEPENYAHFKAGTGGKWNDAPFGANTAAFVCEWEYDSVDNITIFNNNSLPISADGDSSFYLDGTIVLTNGYILPDSSVRYLDKSDAEKLTWKGVRYAINEIYAKHGYTFYKKQELKEYFNSQVWYNGGDTTDQNIVKSRMNDYELKNIDFLVEIENELWGGEYPCT